MSLKTYDLTGRAPREGGETVLGLKDLGTHACYLIYGTLEPGEAPRTLRPGPGHEEIFCVVSGSMKVEKDGESQVIQPGQAFHLVGEDTYQATAAGPLTTVYLAGGGHSEGGHEHH